MGAPTVMAVSGIVAVGTSKGWCLVFDFGQNLRCICGTEGIGTFSPPLPPPYERLSDALSVLKQQREVEW